MHGFKFLSRLQLALSREIVKSRYTTGVTQFNALNHRTVRLILRHSSSVSPFSLVQRKAPDFTSDSVTPDGKIQPLKLSSYLNKYVLLFFYPFDFTFVCPSELLAFDARLEEFKRQNCEVISVSVDSVYSHLAWKKLEPVQGGVGALHYPMVSDLTKQIAKDYGVLTQDGKTSLRGLFLIDKQGIVRHSIVNDLPLGRSVDEALRMLDSLQHFEAVGEVCPANWRKGAKAMKATNEGLTDYMTITQHASKK